MEECHKLLTDSVDDSIPRNNVSKPLPLGGPPGQVTIQFDFFFNKDLEYLRYGSKGNRPTLSISKMNEAYYPDAGLEQIVPDQFWIDEETHMRILSVVRIKVFSMYGYDYMKKIVLRRVDLNEHVIAERDVKYLYPSDFEDLYLLNLQGHLNHLPPNDKKILTTAVNQWIRQLVIRQRVEDFQLGIESYQTQVQMMMRFHEIHKFSDGTLQQIDEALDYRVKEFRINRMNPGLNTRFWTKKDVDRCKAFMFTIQRHLKIRRIFRNLESFVGRRLREGDYRLLKLNFNSLVHLIHAMSALRRSGLRTASTAAKPCQGDSLKFYLITGSIYADQWGTMVLATLFNESEERRFRSFITNIKLRRVPNIVEPEIPTIEEVVPMVDRTIEELHQAPTEGVNTNSRESSSKTDDRIDKLADQILNLVEIVNKQVITPATVKAVEKSCVICGGAHAYYDCIATDRNQSSVCAATGTYNQVSLPNRASNQMAPPGFVLVQNNQNKYNKNQGQGNNFNRGNNFQGYRDPMNHALNFQNQGFQNQPFQAPNNRVQQGILNKFSNYMKSNESLIRNMQTQINVLRGDFNKQEENLRRNLNNDMRSILGSFFQNQAPTSSTLPSNTIPNPKGEMKAITTRSGLAYERHSIPTNSSLEKVVKREIKETTDKEQYNFQGSTAHIQPPVVLIPILKPVISKTQPKPNIPYPSRLNDQKLSKVPLNENCSAMLLKKFFEKLGDPGKFLIPCDSSGMDVCHALADLDASINLLPLSIWKKLSLPELTPTRMTLELEDRSITHPKGVAEYVFFKVGKFHFPTDFVVVDFEADPRVPLILGRYFLRTGRALIDVYGEEITLRVNYESVTFNLNKTMRYSFIYDDNSVNRIDVIDIACEEYAQDVLDFKYNSKSGNPTNPSLFKETKSEFCKELIVKSSPTLTPFGESDFLLEEIEDFLKDESIPIGIEDSCYDPKGDILYLEKLLNDDPSQLPPMDLKQAEETKAKYSIEEPLELELK
nr:hypothetical protein [Tanacetum cinerariifolium]